MTLKKAITTIYNGTVPWNIELFDDNTSSQKALIEFYTVDFAKRLNQFLRTPSLFKQYQEALDVISKCLSESITKNCIRFDNKTVYYYANSVQHQNEWSKSATGKVIQIPTFLSTAKDETSFGNIIYPKFRIVTSEVSRAYDIESFSVKPLENEVLFLPKTNFKIVSITDKYLDLEETQDKADEVVYENTCYFQKT